VLAGAAAVYFTIMAGDTGSDLVWGFVTESLAPQ